MSYNGMGHDFCLYSVELYMDMNAMSSMRSAHHRCAFSRACPRRELD